MKSPLVFDPGLKLPDIPGRGFATPVLTIEQYIRFIESTLRMFRENGTLESMIARRPRPVEEMFVLP